MKALFLLLLVSTTAWAQQPTNNSPQQSNNFYASFSYGANEVVGNYGKYDNIPEIGIDPSKNGYAYNDAKGIGMLTIGYDFSEPKLRVEIMGTYNVKDFYSPGFTDYYFDQHYDGNVATTNYSPYKFYTVMGGVDKYATCFDRFSFSFRLLVGVMHWAIPAITGYYRMFGTNYNFNENSGSALMPCIDAGIGIRIKLVKGFSLLGNMDYIPAISSPAFDFNYSIADLPAYYAAIRPSSGTFHYAPGIPQSFNFTVGIEYMIGTKGN